MAAGDLYAMAREYLDACVAAVALAPAGPIGRYFVSPGPPPLDCPEQVTVYAGTVGEGLTTPSGPLSVGQRTALRSAVNMVELTATVTRCVVTVTEEGGTMTFPDAALIDADGEKTLGDLWAVWNYVRTKHREGVLFQKPSGRRELILEPATPVDTSGGVGGWNIPIRVELDGYAVAP